MSQNPSFTTTFVVDQSPKEVFDAITNVRGWWSQEIEGDTLHLGDEFTYRYQDVHRCKMRVTEAVPGQRIAWRVLDNYFSFTKDKTEWIGTTVEFEILPRDGKTEVRFTHQGLVFEYECYQICADAWTSYVTGSLRNLIATGQGNPNLRSSDQGASAAAGGDFTTSFTVDRSPEEVFAAINDVRGWWGGEIQGEADRIGDEFSYRYKGLHFSRQKVTELVAGKKVVWRVVEAALTFTRNQAEWKGTDIVFDISPKGGRTEVRFTHVGLVPALQCFADCSSGWLSYINGSLMHFISGKAPAYQASVL